MSDAGEDIKEFQLSTGDLQSLDVNSVTNIPHSDLIKEGTGLCDASENSISPESLDNGGSQTARLDASKSGDIPDTEKCSELGNGALDESSDTKLVSEDEKIAETKIERGNTVTDSNQTTSNISDKPFVVQCVEPELKHDLESGMSDAKEGRLSKKTKKEALTVEDRLKRLKQMKSSTMYTDLVCPVCEDTLTDPCLLDCLHSLCAHCVTVEEQKVRCPVCFTETGLCTVDTSLLPKNTVLASLVEKRKTPGSRLCEVCKLMEKEAEAKGFCVECKDYLCQDCWNGHRFTKFTLNHEVISLEGASEEELDKHCREQTEHCNCSRHPGEGLRYYCKGCEVKVCTDCILLDHQNHPCISIQEAFEKQKRKLDLLLKGVDDQIQRIQSEDFESEIIAAEQTEEAEIEKIKSAIEKIIQDLRQQEREAITSVHENFKYLKDKGQKREISAKELLYHLKEAKSICGHLYPLCNSEEFPALEKIIYSRLKGILNTVVIPESLSWFTPPSVELDPLLKTEYKLKPLFKVSNYEKCHDWTEDMPCIATMKNLRWDRELCEKVGHPEWFTNESKLSLEELSNIPITDENLDGFIREGVMDTVRSVDTQSESGSTVNSENYEDMGAKPKTTPPKKKRARKKKNAALSMENISQQGQMADGMMSGRYDTDFYDTSMYGQIPDYTGMPGVYMNPSLYPSYQIPGYFPSAGYMMNSASLTSLTNISKKDKVADGMPQKASKPVKAQTKTSKEKAKPKPAVEDSKGKKTKPAQAKPVNSTVSITPKWRLDTKCSDDNEVPFLTSVHPVSNNKLVVSDSSNNKIKMFSIEGHFIKAFDAKHPTSVVFVSGVLVWTSETTVVIKEQNGEFEKFIKFQEDPIPRPLSWYPHSHFVVSCGNHLRIYHVDKEKQNFTKKSRLSFELPKQKKMSNIFSVRSNGNGKNIVMTDWDLKAVVIGDSEGKVTGMFTGDRGSPWYPGGACFNNTGEIFALDYTHNRLLLLNSEGQLQQEWNTAPTITKPWSVVCGASKQLFITGSDHYVHVYQYSYDDQAASSTQ
ncbi:uncharacterized protein LOC134267413 isoform X2 [Saccostrea cucullata]|uniref:uncharacterized protein LOC134267413 isoform X2 n=1 Tax=Saccostrea cuccullata TaxID=36930 RepID=UPI002ED017E2